MTNGLEAARSPLKILNHVDLTVDHEDIEKRLGLHGSTPGAILQRNKAIVLKHAAMTRNIRGLSVDRTLFDLTRDETEVPMARELLRRYLQCAQVEFHPSDICNEACRGCTYGHDEAAHKPPAVCFPYYRLYELAKLQPRAMTIVGGGEPLLYKDGTKGFADLMNSLRNQLPLCRFGLITNGTLIPPGGWFHHFDWVRFSVDAASPQTYAKVRGRNLFHLVVRNFFAILDGSEIPQVNIGFVFSRENIGEAPDAAHFFYEQVRSHRPEALDRLHIEYRPLRKDSKDEGRTDFPEAVTEQDIAACFSRFTDLARDDKPFQKFLGSQTNMEIIGRGNTHKQVAFEHCGFSSIFRLVRADGEMRPCCMRLFDPEFYLGNLLLDPPESIALNIIANANFLKPGCDAAGCKLGQYNKLTEDGADGIAAPSNNPAIRSNPFFG
jgi:sulfatase maturation enzyme AslB (radical SAM superfamily)